jgi:ABC-type transport system involved in multi-copper enzyme maturation permease subunit
MPEPATLPSERGVASWRPGFSLVGPLFYYDLMRLARRGRSTLLRVTYALVLFGALLIAYTNRFPGHNLLAAPFASPQTASGAELSLLTESFFYSILVVQTAAVLVLTPAYIAGAISEERERGTLELLFTTHLSDREVVLGKMAGRLAHLAGVLLAGLPLVALTQLWGGVDFRLVLVGFYATGLYLLSVGAISIFSSVINRTVLPAVIMSYALTMAFFLVSMLLPILNPPGLFELLATRDMAGMPIGPGFATLPGPTLPPLPFDLSWPEVVTSLGACTVFHGMLTLFFAVAAIGNLRPFGGLGLTRAIPQIAATATNVTGEWGPFDASVPPPSARGNLPMVGNWPLLWKETLPARGGEAITPQLERLLVRGGPLILVLLGVVLVVARPRMPSHQDGVQALQALFRGGVLLAAGLWCAILALRAASGISRERDKGTLEGLLLLPVSRPELLAAKWAGPILYGRGFGYLLAVMLIVALLSGAVHPIGIVLLTMALTAHVAFLASVGVWLSLACRTTLWARVTMAMVLLIFLGISLRAMAPDVRTGAGIQSSATATGPLPWDMLPWRQFVGQTGANAPGSWWFLAFTRDDYAAALNAGNSYFVGRLMVAEAGILAYALAARLLWALACHRFRGEQRR